MEHDARIAPLPRSAWSEPVRQDLETIPLGGPGEVFNIFATLAHHPRLLHRWLPFGGKLLLRGELPDRDRELLILRAARNAGSSYEWGQHVPIALRVGLTRAEIERVAGTSDEWPEQDAVLLRAADELFHSCTLSDPTWHQLAERYGPEQLVEVPLVVGHYTMLAYFLNAFRVPLDEGIEPLPDTAIS